MSPVASTRPVRSRKEDRLKALVQAAFNQIAERGFEGLRTREVAAGVGLNIATLHYYFPTKESLIRGVGAEQRGGGGWANSPCGRHVIPRSRALWARHSRRGTRPSAGSCSGRRGTATWRAPPIRTPKRR